MPKSCLLEVQAFEGNDSLGEGNRSAFVRAYVSDNVDADLAAYVANACEFMGFHMKKLSKVERIEESVIPAIALDGYRGRGVGFGTFHTYSKN